MNYKVNKPFQLTVEITDKDMVSVIEKIINRSINKSLEILPGLKVTSVDKEETPVPVTVQPIKPNTDTDINSYPIHITNCIKNCQKCQARCLYRKEQYKETRKNYNGDWVDIENYAAVDNMLGGFTI